MQIRFSSQTIFSTPSPKNVSEEFSKHKRSRRACQGLDFPTCSVGVQVKREQLSTIYSYVSPVCLLVGWLDCQHECAKTTGWISTKLEWRTDLSPQWTQLTSREDSIKRTDRRSLGKINSQGGGAYQSINSHQTEAAFGQLQSQLEPSSLTCSSLRAMQQTGAEIIWKQFSSLVEPKTNISVCLHH